MIEILLVVIAVGVLLNSKEGRTILTWLALFGTIVGLAYLAFWLIIIIGVFASQVVELIAAVILFSLIWLVANYLQRLWIKKMPTPTKLRQWLDRRRGQSKINTPE